MDIPAQSDTASVGVIPVFRFEAMKASYDAYIKVLESGYERRLGDLQAEHAVEMETAEARSTKAIADTEARLEELRSNINDTIAAEVEKARKGDAVVWERTTKDLKNRVAELGIEKVDLAEQLDAARNQHDRDRTSAEEGKRALEERLETVKAQALKKIQSLRAELEVGPNSWFEITFSSTRFKDRKCVKRPSETLQDVFVEVAKGLAGRPEDFDLELHGKEIKNRKLTLKELGVKNGDAIWVSR